MGSHRAQECTHTIFFRLQNPDAALPVFWSHKGVVEAPTSSPPASPNAAPLVLLPWGDPIARETRVNSTLSGSRDQTAR